MMPRSGASGFTLLELLVVLVLAGLLASMGTPLFSRLLPGLGLETAARDLAATLRRARSDAIFQNRAVAFTLDVDRRRYVVSTDPRATHTIPDDIAVQFLTARTEMSGKATGSIRFYSDGTATGGHVGLSRAGHHRVVTIDWLTGAVEIGD